MGGKKKDFTRVADLYAQVKRSEDSKGLPTNIFEKRKSLTESPHKHEMKRAAQEVGHSIRSISQDCLLGLWCSGGEGAKNRGKKKVF